MENSHGQWYLPAAGELYYALYNNRSEINKGLTTLGLPSLTSAYHWSSSEHTALYTWHIGLGGGTVYSTSKSSYFCIRCFITF